MTDDELRAVPDEYRYDYAGVCWRCGGEAKSREHKWKRSEVVSLFGKGSYGDSVVWIHDDEAEPLRGPKASGLMFSASLCVSCNGARSQPFDRAYEQLSDYLIANHVRLIEERWIDLAEVYGADASIQLPNLARYYGKHIGCRVADGAGRVPHDLKSFLDGEIDYVASVHSEFGLRELLLGIVDENGEPVMGLSLRESIAHYSETPGVGLTTFKSGIGIGAIEFLYDVNLDPERENTGNGILAASLQPLWRHGEDLYAHKFVLG